MNFDDVRIIVEEQFFDSTINKTKHQVSLKDNSDGLSIVDVTDEEYSLRTVTLNSDEIYEEFGVYKVFLDGNLYTPPTKKSYIIVSINDVSRKAATLKGANTVSSGFVRFKMVIPNAIDDATNPRRIAGLMADAIDRRFGFQTGSKVSGLETVPNTGVFSTSKGSLIRVENSGIVQTFNLDFQFDYFK
jgi:hypothetical protein